MSAQLTPDMCTMTDQNGHIECGGFPLVESLVSSVVTPIIAVVPPTGPPGRTTFTLTYQNLAEPAINATRFAELQGYINTIYGSFADTLGNSRDTSNAANAINVNVNLDFASISQAFLITVLFGGPPPQGVGDPAWYQGICWRIRITKFYSTGVHVLEVPMLSLTDPNVWPGTGLAPLALQYDTILKQISFNNVDAAPDVLTPAAWLTLSSDFANTQFYWNYILPSGSTATPVALQFLINGSPPMPVFFSPAQASPAVSAFYTLASTITLGITSSNIGLNILAQAGPLNDYYSLGSQSQTTLWDPTGLTLPTPATPFSSITAATGPLVTSSQWRFLRVLPDWLAPSAAVLRNSFDTAIPLNLPDIQVSINTDLNRLQPGYYDFSDSYLVSNQAWYCFKGVLVHELIHGLGFIEDITANAGPGTKAVSFYNHYAFTSANVPSNASEFQTKPRAIGNVNWISNGVSVMAPIGPTNTSHLLLSSPPDSQNGLMEPVISPGDLIPVGTTPFGGPSKNDTDVLLCCSILSAGASICVRGDTLVATLDGEKVISDVHQGDLVQNNLGEWIAVESCLEIQSRSDFVVIPRGVLSQGDNNPIPNHDLYIRSGHPVLIDGCEIDCAQLIGMTRAGYGSVRKDSAGKGRISVFTLVTQERSFVRMQGVLVGTWSQAAWENYRLNDANSHFSAICH